MSARCVLDFLNLFAAPVRSLTAAMGRDSPAFTSKTSNHTLKALIDFAGDLIKCRVFPDDREHRFRIDG